MSGQTRRQFLTQTAFATGVLALGPLSAHAQDAAGKPLDMCIARWKTAPSPSDPMQEVATKLTEQAMAALGGMKRFVKANDVVWVKPNIGWDRSPEQAANTNPDVVATLVRLCYEAGAKKVKVGDNPCNDAAKSYVNSGIEAAAKAAGAEVIYLDRKRFRDVQVNGAILKDIPIYPDIIECDLVINVPIAKHHSSTMVTLCMKNYMGVIENRRKFHQDLPGCIRDITAYMKPRISVLDATRIMTANGPTGGDLADVKQLNTLAAGTDIVALDAFGAELLGHRPEDIGTVKAAFEGGLGQIDYRKLALREIEVA
jgi:uncharacterized protein (DUF362 family)